MKFLQLLFCFFFPVVLFSQDIVMENDQARMRISMQGGVIKEMNLKSVNVKPIHNYGHFICFDRWGPSSPEDEALGIPWHGEGSKVRWTLDQEVKEHHACFYSSMSAFLPIVKLGMKRDVYLDGTSPVFLIEEQITNYNAGPKVFNLVQHPTIGAPFLDESTIVDTKVDSGFSQAGNLPPGPGDLLEWPEDTVDGELLDLRYLSGDHDWWQAVVSFALDEQKEYAWVTAVNPSLNLMLGYLWSKSDYPWLNLWLNIDDKAPFARGLEFGSTGLHQAWPELLAMDTIFGKKLYEELVAGDSISKSYYAFLSEVPSDYKGVASVELDGDWLIIDEYERSADRRITLDISAIRKAYATPVGKMDHLPDSHRELQLEVYPNPFSHSSHISYQLLVDAKVRLSLYDGSGRLMKTLVDESQSAGAYTMEFSPENLCPGTYVLYLSAGGGQSVRQILFLNK